MLGVWGVFCFARVGRFGLFGMVGNRLICYGIGVGYVCVCVVFA